jgi:isopenicillin N synthase-like dioxygenase
MSELLRRDNNRPSTEDAPNLKSSLETYRLAGIKLMRNLCRALAVAIGEDASLFDMKTTYPSASIRTLFYPPQEGSDEDETGFGAHTDVQCKLSYYLKMSQTRLQFRQ